MRLDNDHNEDAPLIDLLSKGDASAFEVIYHTHSDDIYQYIYRRTVNKEDTEEMVQEIFVSLWTRRETLTHVSSLKAYLLGAAKNTLLNYFRSEKMRQKYFAQFAHFIAVQDNSIEDNINMADLQHTIESEIATLPERCQEAFRLSRIEHLSIADIAQRMDISDRTVENYITQALQHLRKNGLHLRIGI